MIEKTKKVEKDAKRPILKKAVITPRVNKPFIKNLDMAYSAKTRDQKEEVRVEEVSQNQVKITRQKLPKTTGTDASGRTYATGKRKNAVAKVWLKKGSGNVTINGKDVIDYFKRSILEVMINVPFTITNTQGKYDVICTTAGGGLSGQAGAVALGISKALNLLNREAYRVPLKVAGLLTRDSRIVERKKAGLKKARKGQVFSKR
jgi:small subunit ribosomal protein S9